MAQRRTGVLGRSMVVLHRRQSQPEEPRPRPPTPRDLASDFRKRTVTSPVEGDPVIENGYPVSVPLPLADQDRPHFRLSTPWFLRRDPARGLFGYPRQQSTGRGLETAESLLLQAIGDGPDQKGAADLAARRLSIQGL